MTDGAREVQRRIAQELGVLSEFDPAHEADRRSQFLADLLAASGLRTLVVGISGGVDSATAGMLCRRAVRRRPSGAAALVAVRLPYGRQHDEVDCGAVLDAIEPDHLFTVDIRPASDAALAGLTAAGLRFPSADREDHALGNIKARQRMVAQYGIAAALDGLVIGTDHAAEAVTGFFTKFGDGGVDANPLAGLTKRRVRGLARHLGVPEHIVDKTPTADLESLRPQLPDEEVLGLSYEEIDDFLEGRPVRPETQAEITHRYTATAHKRTGPITPPR
ncbi:ammonia-dependent NAD(+) synthetase [Blastococcus sp. CT_GayMR19]|uniref:ammonia-dependent NAD(+) synthetase n=1 Tax=Blastococcus sp. CT_GayMR19 TaxID=2559608 RepID=UPI0010731598|nr:ammonia-dependent NAD(+) synthetase [Blastococcus sp. CT_GayMR19]TFV79364.1 ammonia-dependent NAD(+) synthetase [Blastococcus sp. CT_GayMR19]